MRALAGSQGLGGVVSETKTTTEWAEDGGRQAEESSAVRPGALPGWPVSGC